MLYGENKGLFFLVLSHMCLFLRNCLWAQSFTYQKKVYCRYPIFQQNFEKIRGLCTEFFWLRVSLVKNNFPALPAGKTSIFIDTFLSHPKNHKCKLLKFTIYVVNYIVYFFHPKLFFSWMENPPTVVTLSWFYFFWDLKWKDMIQRKREIHLVLVCFSFMEFHSFLGNSQKRWEKGSQNISFEMVIRNWRQIIECCSFFNGTLYRIFLLTLLRVSLIKNFAALGAGKTMCISLIPSDLPPKPQV